LDLEKPLKDSKYNYTLEWFDSLEGDDSFKFDSFQQCVISIENDMSNLIKKYNLTPLDLS
jgi:hypothetical protein